MLSWKFDVCIGEPFQIFFLWIKECAGNISRPVTYRHRPSERQTAGHTVGHSIIEPRLAKVKVTTCCLTRAISMTHLQNSTLCISRPLRIVLLFLSLILANLMWLFMLLCHNVQDGYVIIGCMSFGGIILLVYIDVCPKPCLTFLGRSSLWQNHRRPKALIF